MTRSFRKTLNRWLIIGVLGLSQQMLYAVQPLLVPFQGYMTASDGTVLEDGVKTVQFKIYDFPVGGESVWAGEVHRLSINGGLINTILGTQVEIPSFYGADMDVATFSRPLYLEITVDGDGNEVINSADPPLLPRQVVLPAPFAARSSWAELATRSESSEVSDSLEGFSWASIMTGTNPSEEYLRAERIQNQSITPEKLSPSALVPVGTVTQSLLPPEVHAQTVGDPQTFDPLVSKWVLADGLKDITASAYGQLVKQQLTPDLRGVFLRGINHGRPDIYKDPDGERHPGNLQGFAVQQHKHDVPIGYHENPSVNGWAMSQLNNAIGQHRGETYEAGTSSETRPTNVAVYHYLKIN